MPKNTPTAPPWTVGDGYVWHTDEATGMGFRFKPIEFAGGCLAWVAADEGDEEAESNAAVIAAAPEMLELLRSIFLSGVSHEGAPISEGGDLGSLIVTWEEIRDARALIEKLSSS